MSLANFWDQMAPRLQGAQDACWDQVCPSTKKDEKLACLKASAARICDCCQKRHMPDCQILVPGQGLVDPCQLTGRGTGGSKDHFCACVQELCPNCRKRSDYQAKETDIVDCCQGKCQGGSCNYECNQIALDYLTPNSMLGDCLPPEAPPAPPRPAPPAAGAGFYSQNKGWIWAILGLILVIAVIALVGMFVRKKKVRR